MILLCCAKIPDGINKAELADLVRLGFPNKANAEYIAALEQKGHESAACESLYALALLRKALVPIPSLTDPSDLVLSRSANGKPYFVNSELRFNLSHSNGTVACALSDEGDVGVDVEASRIEIDRAKRISRRFFSLADAESIEHEPNRFARLWSEKEAVAKFFGTNLSEFLEIERKNEKAEKNMQISEKVALHRFSYCKIPITLCTTRDFSTINFIFAT